MPVRGISAPVNKFCGSKNDETKRCQRAAVKRQHEQPKKDNRPERHGSNGAGDFDAGIYQHACLKSAYAFYQSLFAVASLSCKKIIHLYESSSSEEA